MDHNPWKVCHTGLRYHNLRDCGSHVDLKNVWDAYKRNTNSVQGACKFRAANHEFVHIYNWSGGSSTLRAVHLKCTKL